MGLSAIYLVGLLARGAAATMFCSNDDKGREG